MVLEPSTVCNSFADECFDNRSNTSMSNKVIISQDLDVLFDWGRIGVRNSTFPGVHLSRRRSPPLAFPFCFMRLLVQFPSSSILLSLSQTITVVRLPNGRLISIALSPRIVND